MTKKLFCPNCDSNRIIPLPIERGLHVCPDCRTRQFLTENTEWRRDFYGEAQWEKMASYTNKTYEEIFDAEYSYFSQKK